MNWLSAMGAALGAAGRKGLSLVAAGIAFYMLLSLFPAAAVVVSIVGLVIDPGAIEDLLTQLAPVAPAIVIDTLRQVVEQTLASGGAKLGATALISFAIAVWSAGAAVRALLTALQVAFPQTHAYGLWVSLALSLVFTLIAMALTVVVIIVLLALPWVFTMARALSEHLPLPDAFRLSDAVVAWIEPVMMIVIATALLTAIYWLGAAGRRARLGSAVAAGFATTLLWLAASWGLAWYFAAFADLGAVYGPFGAVAGLMLWFWISALLVLIGAEYAAALESKRADAPEKTSAD